jgi:hypothetical protein
MKKLVVVCLGVLLLAPATWCRAGEPEPFEPARRIGESNTPSFFLFSTSAGNYIIRHDGMGEVEYGGMRRVFYLKVGEKHRLERVYFREHDGDLFLLYEVSGQQFYLLRMEQKKRKPRWLATLPVMSEAPVIDGDMVIVGDTVVSKIDGRMVRQAQD